MRSGEKEGAGALVEKIDEVARAADVTAERADGSAERADLDIHTSVAIEMVNGAAAAIAEDAGGVRVVNHHDAIIFFGERAEGREIGDVAVHGKYAIGDEEFFAGPIF